MTIPASERIVEIANAILAGRYPDAAVAFAAGSIVRGEATPYSDLDLVVVYPRLACAARESFRHDGCPVEAFLHDPETLEYFFGQVDRPSGVPALPQMVAEGIEIPAANDLSRALRLGKLRLLCQVRDLRPAPARDRADIGRLDTGENAKKRALARPVHAHDADPLARPHCERDAVEHGMGPESLR